MITRMNGMEISVLVGDSSVGSVVITAINGVDVDVLIGGVRVSGNESSWQGGGVDLNNVDVNSLPEGWWSPPSHNGHTHVKSPNGKRGNTRIRFDPPDKVGTPYPHKHYYDEEGNALDINGNRVPKDSPDAHIPLE